MHVLKRLMACVFSLVMLSAPAAAEEGHINKILIINKCNDTIYLMLVVTDPKTGKETMTGGYDFRPDEKAFISSNQKSILHNPAKPLYLLAIGERTNYEWRGNKKVADVDSKGKPMDFFFLDATAKGYASATDGYTTLTLKCLP